MAEAARDMTSARRGSPAARAWQGSASLLFQHLVWLYVEGSAASVAVAFLLAGIGLEFTAYQWLALLSATPLGLVFYLVPDIYVLARHFRPIRAALAPLARGERPTPAEASAAVVRALNLPFLSFMRITFLHGPLSTVALLVIM